MSLLKLLQSVSHGCRILVPPNPNHFPANLMQHSTILVATAVGVDLVQPALTVCLGNSEMLGAPVPEEAIHKHCNLHSPKDNDRTARQITPVSAEPNTAPVKFPARDNLWLGVANRLSLQRPADDIGGGLGTVTHTRSEASK